MVVYTGKSHHSGINNFQALSRAVQGDSQTLRALKEIHEIAEEMEIVIRESHWNRIANLFKREFAARVQLAEAFSSPEIEKLHEISIKAGAEALKICGAGGGGCVLIWTSPEKKEGNKSVLEGVPKSLPALVKAMRIQEEARGAGFDWEEKQLVWEKVEEEMNEFKEEFNAVDGYRDWEIGRAHV